MTGVPGPALLTVSLIVPEPWARAAEEVATALTRAFPDLPPQHVAPHISLRQSFVAADVDRAAAAVARALDRMRPGPIAVGDVRAFVAADDTPAVVYLDVAGAWLRLAHQRVLRETEAVAASPPAGNPAFELGGFRPHITLATPRDLPTSPSQRRAVAERAEHLWRALRPPGDGFDAEVVALSRWHTDGGEPLRVYLID